MQMTILDLVQNYGFNSVLIAMAVCVLTGLVKKPIKFLAAKTSDSQKYTKYITFLPLILGFGVTVLYEYIVTKSFIFTGEFVTLWLTSISLSLAIYAFIEKFIPSKKKILSKEEIKQNEEMLNKIKEYLLQDKQVETSEQRVEPKKSVKIADLTPVEANIERTELQADGPMQEKIILRGRND